jgi:predicted RNA-binding Zn-ribbon protein involved in translation (DUF1610 family)
LISDEQDRGIHRLGAKAMSIERPVDLACPHCGHEQSVVVSPHARDELFAGRINVFLCESCGQNAVISIPLLYHDMKRRFTVQFYPFEALDDDEFVQGFDPDGTNRQHSDAFPLDLAPQVKLDMEYLRRPHIVFDMGELTRYVLFREHIFDALRDVEARE